MKLLQSTILMIVLFGIVACGNKKEAQNRSRSSESMPMQEMETHEAMAKGEHAEHPGEGEQLIYYTCPMENHKHIHSIEPGKCPECGMELVAVVQTTEDNMDYYGCKMPEHSHIRSSDPGKCSECGMDLVPMRLMKG